MNRKPYPWQHWTTPFVDQVFCHIQREQADEDDGDGLVTKCKGQRYNSEGRDVRRVKASVLDTMDTLCPPFSIGPDVMRLSDILDYNFLMHHSIHKSAANQAQEAQSIHR